MKKLIILSLLVLSFSSPAFADKPAKVSDNGVFKSNGHFQHNDENVKFVIPSNDRNKILSYMKQNYRSKCPPGLAKKNNGCLPPGQAKHYEIGQRPGVDTRSVPQKLLDILSPPPRGASYRMVDNDVVLISQQNQQVLDAVSVLSALSQ